jgi:hypothetical protein
MSIEVGDAVLRFLGDSTDLNTKFAEVGPNAQKAFEPAAEAAEEAGERMKVSMHEARGEVALLGEEFGIRLPRHVRSFVAELPGVGEALQAAFSATAILFVAQAVAQAAEKLSNFIANTEIFTDAMRESNNEVEHENKVMGDLATIYNTAKERLDALNGSTKSWEDAQRAAAQATVEETKAELENLKVRIANKTLWDRTKESMSSVSGVINSLLIPGYIQASTAAEDQNKILTQQGLITKATAAALKATNEVNAEEAAKNAKLALDNSVREIENQKKVALAYAQNDQEKFEIEQHFEQKKLDLLNEYAVKDKAAIQALLTTIEVQQIQHAEKVSAAFVNMLKLVQATKEQALGELKTADLATAIELTPLQAAFKKGADAAHLMGVTLRTDLVMELDRARASMKAFLESGIVDKVAFKGLDDAINKADADLKKFGKTEDSFLSKSRAWKQFQQDIEGGKHAIDQLKISGAQAFDDIGKDIEGAFQSIVLGQQNVGQALEKALAQSLASIAAQAAVKALFYTAEGIAMLAVPFGAGSVSAGQYFAAAGEMAAVAGVAGGAAFGLSKAGDGSGGSRNNAQGHDSASNTGQSNRSGGSSFNVQAFAEGGLLTGPTIMLGGEAGREAVLPLSNPNAMSEIGTAIGKHGGGTTHHWHIDGGMISADTLTKVVKQISRMVDKGQVHLTASNSLRLTKRSA